MSHHFNESIVEDVTLNCFWYTIGHEPQMPTGDPAAVPAAPSRTLATLRNALLLIRLHGELNVRATEKLAELTVTC